MLAPVKPFKLSDQIFEQLRDEILLNKYLPGDRLPSERELCDVLKVNRGSVREALKRLEQARLIDVRHGNGSVVLDIRTNAGLDLLGDMINPGGEVDFVAVRSILEFRSLIAPEVARLAALRIQAPDLEKFRLIVERIEACPEDDLKSLQSLDYETYEIMVQATENLAIILLTNSIRDIYISYMDSFSMLFEPAMKNRGYYRELLNALAAHDGEQCRELAADMLEQGNKAFLEKFSGGEQSGE